MSVFVIVSPKVDRNDLSVHTDALEEVMVDYADLLRLTLDNWHQFGPLPEDLEGLRASMEHHLSTYAARRLKNYEHMQDMVALLVESITKFHENLNEQLGPLLEKYGVDVHIYLHRFLANDAIVRVETSI